MKALAAIVLMVWVLFTSAGAQATIKGPVQRPGNPSVSTCSGRVLNMKAAYLPAPLYPQEAKNTVSASILSVMVEVNEKGNITIAKACAGHQLLRPHVEDAARRARIMQTILNGVPVKVRGVLNYSFDPQRSYTDPVVLYCGPTMNIIKVLNGYAIDLVKPERPQGAPDNLSTAVSVLITVDETGKTEKVEAVSGDLRFRPIAEEAAKRSTFRRFIKCDKPTKISSVLTFNFPGR